MKYFCKSCDRVLNDGEIYQTTETQTLSYWGVPVKETIRNNHCCYCESEDVDCLNTDDTVYTVSHKVGKVIIVNGPYKKESDANEQVEFYKEMGIIARKKEW